MATVEQRVGRGGFTGSPITAWCDGCEDYVVAGNRGECLWCGHRRLVVVPKPRPSFAPVRGVTEAGIFAAHARYLAEPVAVLDVATRIFVGREYSGYRTASDLSYALRRAWDARGLPLRSKSEAAAIRARATGMPARRRGLPIDH